MADGSRAYVSRYALGRDYHKVHARAHAEARRPHRGGDRRIPLPRLHRQRAGDGGGAGGRPGLGWRGKHTLLLNREAGSYFFLGEIYTDLPLPVDEPQSDHCGTLPEVHRHLSDPGDRRRPTSSTRGAASPISPSSTRAAIPEELRPLIGNRVYGCDDCQLVCPWNKFAQPSGETDFAVRNGLDDVTLVELFSWTEDEFDERLAGSAIRRIGYEQWLRNLAVGLGNAPTSAAVVAALESRADHPSALVREHVAWALDRHRVAQRG